MKAAISRSETADFLNKGPRLVRVKNNAKRGRQVFAGSAWPDEASRRAKSQRETVVSRRIWMLTRRSDFLGDNPMSVSIAVERTRSPKGRPSEDKLGFGKVFTDHMFQMNHDAARGWHSARVVPYQPLALDPSASALHYCQPSYEGMKCLC